MISQNISMLLVLPVPFKMGPAGLMMEVQATNGLARWADNFGRVTLAAPVMPDMLAAMPNGVVWKDAGFLRACDRVRLVALPWAYHPFDFARCYFRVRRLLGELIQESDYLQFGVGGLFGDWAAVAALEANSLRRKFAVHADRVEHEVLLEVTRRARWPDRLKSRALAALMRRYHRRIISKCSLGLWHGSDCFHAYSPWCRENHVIHDIHTSPLDRIREEVLSSKVEQINKSRVLKICYAGRLDPMKAPMDWVKAIAVARDMGALVEATWYGEGPLRAEVEGEVKRLGLCETITLPGFTSDRQALLGALRDAHLMAFTHVTPESPRCLIEALVSGTPIVGYESRFACDLTAESGGGRFVRVHDWEGLGRLIAELSKDRTSLGDLVKEASTSGERFNDVAVFHERSQLIKRFA